jgi:predicted alpha/beta superfamily hydrolase
MALDYIITQLSYSETAQDYALLLVHDGIAVYGCLTNTNVKILVGADAQDSVRFDLKSVRKGKAQGVKIH